MHIDITRSVDVSLSPRVRQLAGIFDVPIEERNAVHWEGEIELPDEWSVGLIVGPSGSGKTTLARELFGEPHSYDWTAKSVIDDFSSNLTINDISSVCSAVGFNTIPAWMRPYDVLSNGERFRVELARMMLEHSKTASESVPATPLIVDEFTSVVDRQVAKIGSHAVQKWIRSHKGMQFVACSCHYDIIDWLQPDWVLEMPTLALERRGLRRRPAIQISIARASYAAWHLFAPFHYLTKELNQSAKCFVLYVHDDEGAAHPAAFCASLHRPHATAKNIEGMSRIVTLPDWQGLGLAHIISDTVASAFVGIGKRFHTYPAHPAFVRGHDKSPHWAMMKRPGVYSPAKGKTTGVSGKFGGRPCAVFRYVGPVMEKALAQSFLDGVPVTGSTDSLSSNHGLVLLSTG